MNKLTKTACRILFVLFLIGTYSTVSLVICTAHNHKIDGNFHENCPACQWEVLTQENDTSFTALEMLLNPLMTIAHVIVSQNIFPAQQDTNPAIFSRAPPLTHSV